LHTANQRISIGGNRASLEATCFVLGNNYFLHLCLFFFSPLTLRYSAFAAFAAATAALLLVGVSYRAEEFRGFPVDNRSVPL
jgi:hypothetical protein